MSNVRKEIVREIRIASYLKPVNIRLFQSIEITAKLVLWVRTYEYFTLAYLGLLDMKPP